MKLDSNFKQSLKTILSEKDSSFRHKLNVFLVCLGLSIVIWFLIVLSKESATTLVYPIHFTNQPGDMILVNKPDSMLTFRVASGGFELLTLKYLSRRKPIEINLGNLVPVHQNGYYTATYSTSQIAGVILEKHSFSEELVSISPEDIHFRFEPKAVKKIPVVSNLEISFEKQYRLADSLTFIPDSVKITGPDELLNEIRFIATESKTVENVKDEVMVNVGLDLLGLDENIHVLTENVQVKINAEKYTEHTLNIPVTASNDAAAIRSYPAEVSVTFLVSLENFKRMDPELFIATIDVSGPNRKARVFLKYSPTYVDIIRIEPEYVEYLLLKQ